MKRSAKVLLGVAFVAASVGVAGCGEADPDYQQVCVEEDGDRVEDAKCPDASGHHSWYYIPYHTSAPAVGGRVSGGSYVKPAGAGITAPVRGGFGGARGGSGGG